MRYHRLGLFVAAIAMIATACQYTVTNDQLTVVQAQEDGFLQNGDEPYPAVVAWRSTPGVAGSTSVQYLGNLQEFASGLDDGDTVTVPLSMGEAFFDDIDFIGFPEVLNGQLPELVGTLIVMFEHDLTSFSSIDNIMEDVRDALEVELANVIEPLTLADLTDISAVSDDLAAAAAAVEAAATPGILDSILLFLGSLGNPDDLIGTAFTIYAAAAGNLALFLESALSSALPPGNVGGTLNAGNGDGRTDTIRFSGDGAIYDMTVVIDNLDT